MSKFLGYLKFSMLLSGIIAELLPSILSEFRKRDEKALVVTKVTKATQDVFHAEDFDRKP